ncbi:cuticle protein 8-like [Homarus americanus]|uniref:cuticle protein 8-like n=1 Tax=Homarus americanus TaxID=6706 RepID=UPI001C450D6A|nr:cuticle protein 8-like [Homarus americanus]
MFTKAFILMVVLGVVMATPSDIYSAPRHPTGYREEPKPYNFNYGVKDDYAGTDFSQNEESDGNTVQGSYTVQLPDGRKQTVTYVADDYGGYRAEVEYYGEAQYPHEYGPPITFRPQAYGQPSYQPPVPSYQ